MLKIKSDHFAAMFETVAAIIEDCQRSEAEFELDLLEIASDGLNDASIIVVEDDVAVSDEQPVKLITLTSEDSGEVKFRKAARCALGVCILSELLLRSSPTYAQLLSEIDDTCSESLQYRLKIHDERLFVHRGRKIRFGSLRLPVAFQFVMRNAEKCISKTCTQSKQFVQERQSTLHSLATPATQLTQATVADSQFSQRTCTVHTGTIRDRFVAESIGFSDEESQNLAEPLRANDKPSSPRVFCPKPAARTRELAHALHRYDRIAEASRKNPTEDDSGRFAQKLVNAIRKLESKRVALTTANLCCMLVETLTNAASPQCTVAAATKVLEKRVVSGLAMLGYSFDVSSKIWQPIDASPRSTHLPRDLHPSTAKRPRIELQSAYRSISASASRWSREQLHQDSYNERESLPLGCPSGSSIDSSNDSYDHLTRLLTLALSDKRVRDDASVNRVETLAAYVREHDKFFRDKVTTVRLHRMVETRLARLDRFTATAAGNCTPHDQQTAVWYTMPRNSVADATLNYRATAERSSSDAMKPAHQTPTEGQANGQTNCWNSQHITEDRDNTLGRRTAQCREFREDSVLALDANRADSDASNLIGEAELDALMSARGYEFDAVLNRWMNTVITEQVITFDG